MIHLSQSRSSIIFAHDGDSLEVLYWGKKLGAIDKSAAESIRAARTKPAFHGGLDVAPGNLILREHARGWIGHPALRGHRGGVNASNAFAVTSAVQKDQSMIAVFTDAIAGIEIEITYTLTPSDILLMDAKVTNTAEGDYFLDHFLYWLPLAEQANEVLDFYGHWTKERQPQRRSIDYGLLTREGFEGRSGHDYTITQVALNHATGFRHGEAWSLAMAWSGNNIHHVERLIDGHKSIGAGEYLLPGEVILKKGESYVAPRAIATFSDRGLDGLTNNHYSWIRSRSNHITKVRPRPLTLNMWEAVYFNHNEEGIRTMVDKAADIGVERVVLDDGWFGSRRNDRAGLGDWVVSKDAWPNGLGPIIKYINDKGIEFGLWFEGEMVNRDSDLYRAHPDWILQEPGRLPIEGRWQQVLDLTKEGAYNHVLNQVDAVLSEYNIAYIKWDHNRHLTDPISDGRPVVRKQTEAIYRMFDELKKRHPGLEIESCSSGGGRIDLGMIEHADRFWTSDQNDPLERQQIQRWTGLVIPPEFLGTHVGPTVGHQMHRTHSVSFRALNALFGHAGIEWNISEADAKETQTLKAYIAFYKNHRDLLHSGTVVRSDEIVGNAQLYGTVSLDKKEAIFTYMQLTSLDNFGPLLTTFDGLDKETTYRITVVEDLSADDFIQKRAPGWWPALNLTGDQLAHVGLQLPVLKPESGLLFHIQAL
ncbi:alpha-galactosidase [Candidatus Planktophila dulcis]|uniref:alpha-galactosidase n=1 Tax=Candidatus Planktophila dulcis TaxID=1884914 RepID=UPI003CF3B442